MKPFLMVSREVCKVFAMWIRGLGAELESVGAARALRRLERAVAMVCSGVAELASLRAITGVSLSMEE